MRVKWFKSEHIESTDESLISKYKKSGQMDDLSDLYSKYIELVYGLCLKYFKDEEKSKDAVMDIYELVSKKILTHDVKHFKSWLYILSKNHCLGEIRKKTTEKHKKQIYYKVNGHRVYHPFEEDMRETQLQQLESCIEHLIETQQSCIKMFYLEKQSYKEIAKQLKMSWSTSIRLISGRVTDENGRPINDVLVLDVKSGNGGSTDKKGYFELEIDTYKTKLIEFSHLGYRIEVINPANIKNDELNVVLTKGPLFIDFDITFSSRSHDLAFNAHHIYPYMGYWEFRQSLLEKISGMNCQEKGVMKLEFKLKKHLMIDDIKVLQPLNLNCDKTIITLLQETANWTKREIEGIITYTMYIQP